MERFSVTNQRQKPPDQLTGHRKVAPLRALPPAANRGPLPELGFELLEVTKAIAEDMWASQVAQAWDMGSDLAEFRQLLWCMDERERARRAIRKKGRIVATAKGVSVNPLLTYFTRMDQIVSRLSGKFGLTLQDRMRLGIDLGRAKRSMADWNDDMDDDGPEDGGAATAGVDVLDLDEDG